MPYFFATTPRGLEDVLEEELKALGLEKTKKGIAGVSFFSNWAGCYRANLFVRSASRILYPVLDFPAYEPDQIYHNVLKHDFTKYIDPKGTIAMDSSVRDSIIKDLRIVSLKAKDAVVDQFREKYGVRPNVDPQDPDLQISLRLVKNMCTVSLDTSGGSLHQRGYRVRASEAPLKENLAAALVKLSGWEENSPLVDPMCGSGTLCIEAALMALKIPPGTFRRRFGFQRWKTFQKESFLKIQSSIEEKNANELGFKIFGYDKSGKAVKDAQENSENAGTHSLITFAAQDLSQLKPPADRGTLITNPPYGERMGSEEDLVGLYQELGGVLRTHFQGWKCYVLTSSRTLGSSLDMKPQKKFRVFNGALECEFLGFWL